MDQPQDIIVGRNFELEYLDSLLNSGSKKSTPLIPSVIFIHGDCGTGKSYILKKYLEKSSLKFAFMNCIEAYSSQVFFEQILNNLTKHKLSKDNNYMPYAKCSNSLDFVAELKKYSELKLKMKTPIVIVLDRCEKLRKFDKDLLPIFFKLRELTHINICVVFISILPWTNLYKISEYPLPVNIYFRKYTKLEICDILKLDQPTTFSTTFYENYLHLFLSIFHQVCHDVNELKYQAKKNFTVYSKPIVNCELTESDANALWKRSQPIFKKSLKALYLKIDSDEEEMLTSVTSHALKMELPFYLKYMLIGGYIASFNSASEDKRLFVKNHGKERRRKSNRKKVVNQHLIGPKTFGLQRLFAIVTAILDDKKFTMNADLFMGVTTLVKMNLLTQVSPDVLDGGSFKCNASLQFVSIIAKNVNFPLVKYLVDFRTA